MCFVSPPETYIYIDRSERAWKAGSEEGRKRRRGNGQLMPCDIRALINETETRLKGNRKRSRVTKGGREGSGSLLSKLFFAAQLSTGRGAPSKHNGQAPVPGN